MDPQETRKKRKEKLKERSKLRKKTKRTTFSDLKAFAKLITLYIKNIFSE